MDLATLKRLEDHLRTLVPDFEVKFKNESKVQRFLGMLMPFNPGYVTSFVSTFGSTLYFPSRVDYETKLESSFETLAHEFVHIYDSKQSVWFKLSYAFPQVLAVIPLTAYAVLAGLHSWILLPLLLGYALACWVKPKSNFVFGLILGLTLTGFLAVGWLYTGWSLLSLLGLVVLGPWPAPWRVHWELRGYGMDIAVAQWMYNRIQPKYEDFLVEVFTGSSYFYMSRNATYIRKTAEATRQQAEAGALQKVAPYSSVYAFLQNNLMTYRP